MDIKSIGLGVTNCYLVESKGKYIMVDTGYENEWDKICEGMKSHDISFDMISHLVLTHHHDDHSGLLNRVIAKNPYIKIVMSDKACELLAAGNNNTSHGACWVNKRVKFIIGMLSKMSKGMTGKFPPYIARDIDVRITKDTSLADIGIELNGKIIDTKGHTIDSISIIFDDGDFISGDAAADLFGFAGTKNCGIFISDLDEFYNSWDKIISAGAKTVYPGHGKPFGIINLKRNLRKNTKRNLVKM